MSELLEGLLFRIRMGGCYGVDAAWWHLHSGCGCRVLDKLKTSRSLAVTVDPCSFHDCRSYFDRVSGSTSTTEGPERRLQGFRSVDSTHWASGCAAWASSHHRMSLKEPAALFR